MTLKYVFDHGIMKVNSEYIAEQQAAGFQSSVADPSKAMAILSSPADIMMATEASGAPIQMNESAIKPMEMMQSQAYIDQFKAPDQVDGGKLVDGIASKFADLEIPIGMLGKIMALSSYHLNFMIDDSGSMGEKSDVTIKQANSHTKKNIQARFKKNDKTLDEASFMTRWEEAEDRLHVMLSLLQYIPVSIRISFLNRSTVIDLIHDGKSPAKFAKDAHHQIRESFINRPAGGTPIYGKLNQAFTNANGYTMHYLFTDGEPSDKSIDYVTSLVIHRKFPECNPLTFITCSDNDEDTAWVKKVDEKAKFTAELDDFNSERKEVLRRQGSAFPYSKGLWYICQLVAAINPHDLDALDEKNPMTKGTVDGILGRWTSPEEYQYYFNTHPKAREFANLYQQFARVDLVASQILPPKNTGIVYSQTGSHTMWNQSGPSIGFEPASHSSKHRNRP